MNIRLSKNNRTLDLYTRFCKGKVINKAEEAKRFGVDARSIQRDIDDIRSFLDECAVTDLSDTRKIIYDRMKKGFVMTGNDSGLMDNSEILAVSKILLESRAFSKREITSILDKLVLGCVPGKNRELVSELIANEKYHYVELCHKSYHKEKLWGLGTQIRRHNILELTYYRQADRKDPVKRSVCPVAILFSEYYFYLHAYIVEKNGHGVYEKKYDHPAIFRLDRIKSYKETGERFEIPYIDRFEEGEYRKRIQFMYAGDLVRLQFRYMGENVETVLDRLPTAKVISREDGIIIEAEAYGQGILMWLLSQGTVVEVLRPESLRQEMKEKAQEIVRLYI